MLAFFCKTKLINVRSLSGLDGTDGDQTLVNKFCEQRNTRAFSVVCIRIKT